MLEVAHRVDGGVGGLRAPTPIGTVDAVIPQRRAGRGLDPEAVYLVARPRRTLRESDVVTTTTAELLDRRGIARSKRPELGCSRRHGAEAAGNARRGALHEIVVRSRHGAIERAVLGHERVTGHPWAPFPCRLAGCRVRSGKGGCQDPHATGVVNADADDRLEVVR